MAETKGTPDVARFEERTEDVTCCCEMIFCGGSKMVMGSDEVEYTANCCGPLCVTKKRGPYGELGTVDVGNCCCFHGFSIGSFFTEGEIHCTGCGCERDRVADIVEELKKRQGLRGDRAKTRMQETTLAELSCLHKKVDAIMAKLEVPQTAEMER